MTAVRLGGRILFGDDAAPFVGATAEVFVEDTTYADAHAVRVASWRKEGVAYPADARGIPFEIVVDPEPAEGRRCTLRVLIDLDGDGAPGPGDFMNVESVPVRRGVDEIEVRVRRLRA